ncbi:MAG: ATP-binding protein [Pirellulaceae bacterium]|nr:ATP-binding protein [Pirellulaceae bacterium]
MTFKQPGAFIKHLIDNGLKRHRPVVGEGYFETHTLDLSDLKLRTSRFTPFMIPRQLSGRAMVTPAELRTVLADVTAMARSVSDEILVLVVGGVVDHEALSPREFGERGVVVLDKSDMDQIEAARSRDEKLNRLGVGLRRYLGLRALSPYVVSRPAVAGRFFGRSEFLDTILAGKEGANYTFIGNRRIGKTSLLREIKDRLKVKYLKEETFRFAEVYGANCGSTFDVIHAILSDLNPNAAGRLTRDMTLVKQFPRQIRDLSERENVEVAVFIDEVDYLLAFDEKQSFQLLHLLRSAFEHESCRIFFAGFRSAIAAANDVNHPLHNFTKMRILKCLGMEETNEMVTVPLTRLGIDVKDLPATVYRETGGHPELVQMVCERIVGIIAKTGKVPDATELLRQLFEEDFELRIFQTFIVNTDPYERLLCYLLVREATKSQVARDRFEFSESDARKLMTAQNVGVDSTWMRTIVKNLEVSSITKKVAGTARWKFAVPQLVRYCAERELDESIAVTRQDALSTPKETLLHWPKEHELSN